MLDGDLLILTTQALLCLAVLTGGIAFLLWLRRPRSLRAKCEKIQWAGTAFDASRVTPRIERLRQDPIGALHSRPHPLRHAPALLAAARKSICHLPYFHDSAATVEARGDVGPRADRPAA